MISLNDRESMDAVLRLLRDGRLSLGRLTSENLVRRITEEIPREMSEDESTQDTIDYVMYNRYRYIDDIKKYQKRRGFGES